MASGANRNGPIRRRRVLAGAVAVMALAAGAATGAGLLGSDDEGGGRTPGAATDGPAKRAEPSPTPSGPGPALPDAATRARVARLPLDRLAGQAVVLRFAGTTVPGYVREALRERRAAGAILFKDNAATPAVTRRIARTLRRAGGGTTIVCLDQEGGEVRVLPWAAPDTGQRALTSAAAVGRAARAAGRDLRANGITVTLAPVADVGRPGSALEGRTFSDDAVTTAPAPLRPCGATAGRASRRRSSTSPASGPRPPTPTTGRPTSAWPPARWERGTCRRSGRRSPPGCRR